jgi:hypothetical protein
MYAGLRQTLRTSPYVHADERFLRPPVTARKISGGTRSPQGPRTAEVLMSHLGTWAIRGQDTLQACRTMLAGQSP